MICPSSKLTFALDIILNTNAKLTMCQYSWLWEDTRV